MIQTKDILTVAGPTTTGRPFLNENQLMSASISTSSTFLTDKRTLMNWIKRTPEAIGILRQLAMDIITQIQFIPVEDKSMGRPATKKAKNNEREAILFSRNYFLKQQLRAAVIEGVGLGDGYIWKGDVNKDQIKEIASKLSKKYNMPIEQKAIDEALVGKKALQYVPSATMHIELKENGTEIKSYVQRTTVGFSAQTFPSATLRSTNQGSIPGVTRRWSPERIIHYRFMELDGKVHGFTPFQSSFPIMKTLGAIKDYHGHYFESGITPEMVFNFAEMDSNSPEFYKMQQVIQEWYNNKRRGSLVTTSKMTLEKINEWNKDMEFRMLAIYYTGVIAFSVGMPLEKIRAILGGEIKSTTGGSDISNTDYQRNISDIQDDWENLLNTQFFNEEFGVDIRFDRTAARDEMAEVQRDAQKLNIIQQMRQMDLIKKDKFIEFQNQYFPQYPSDWWNPNPKPEMNEGMIPSSKIIPGQAKQAFSDEKKKQQKPQQKNNPPTGFKK